MISVVFREEENGVEDDVVMVFDIVTVKNLMTVIECDQFFLNLSD